MLQTSFKHSTIYYSLLPQEELGATTNGNVKYSSLAKRFERIGNVKDGPGRNEKQIPDPTSKVQS